MTSVSSSVPHSFSYEKNLCLGHFHSAKSKNLFLPQETFEIIFKLEIQYDIDITEQRARVLENNKNESETQKKCERLYHFLEKNVFF